MLKPQVFTLTKSEVLLVGCLCHIVYGGWKLKSGGQVEKGEFAKVTNNSNKNLLTIIHRSLLPGTRCDSPSSKLSQLTSSL